MHQRDDDRTHAVQRLQGARERRATRSEQYQAASGSTRELPAFTDLKAAEEQCAAREAWLEWMDRGY